MAVERVGGKAEKGVLAKVEMISLVVTDPLGLISSFLPELNGTDGDAGIFRAVGRLGKDGFDKLRQSGDKLGLQ